MSFDLPPTIYNADGEQRRIGFELEFAGIEIDKAAQIITALYGGKIKKEHRYHVEISGSSLGDFRVELDAQLLQRLADQKFFEKLGIKPERPSIGKSIEGVVDKLARAVVPLEIVMPPIEVQQIGKLEELRKALQRNRAEGTKASVVHAFGMHINIEAPDLQIPTLLKYFRSFLLVYPWLLQKLKIDISRRITPFVDPFPKKYVCKVLDPSYHPVQDQFIEDYLQFNPTRNRPLDMMPIFGMLNKKLIHSAMKGEKNDPRPTFHYRLPNSHIDEPDWRFEDEWMNWLVVEQLVNKDEMVHKLSRLYIIRQKEAVLSFYKEWAETIIIMLGLDES